MRVLIIALHFTPDQVSGGYETTWIAEELVRLGHQVTVVTAFPFHKAHRIEPPFRRKLWSVGLHRGARVIRTWLWVRGSKEQVRGRMVTYATFNAASTAAAVLLARKHDVVLTPSPPLTNGLAAFVYGFLYRVPFVYVVRDVYPDVAVQLGLITGRRTIAFFEWLERFIYRHAASVVVLTRSMLENLERKGFRPPHVQQIPHSIDTEFIRPLPRENHFARQWGLHDKFVVMYAGNMGLAQGLETVLEAADLLRDVPDVLFALVGDGAARHSLEETARERSLTNVRFLPFVSGDDVPFMHASADVGLAVLKRGVAANAMPAKLYANMASERATIAAVEENSSAAELVRDANAGLIVEPESAEALAEAVRRLAGDRELCRRLGENGRTHAVEHYSRTVVCQRYERLLAQVSGMSGPP